MSIDWTDIPKLYESPKIEVGGAQDASNECELAAQEEQKRVDEEENKKRERIFKMRAEKYRNS